MSTIVNATASPQQAADRYLWDQNGKLVYAQDLQGSSWGEIYERDWDFADAFNYTNGVMGSGLQVSAGSGMSFSISAGRARAMNALKVVQLVTAGGLGQPSSFNFTLAAGTGSAGQSRIDVIALRYQWLNYTDTLGTENHQVDNTSIVTIQGTSASSPVAPSLPDSSYVQIAQVTIPSTATTAAQCTIDNTKRTSYGNISGPSVGIVPIGGGTDYYGSTWTDDGHFMVRDGRILTIASYPELYAVIGTTWGTGNGDGLSYNIPDSRSRYAVGADNMGTGAANRIVNATGFTANNAVGNTSGAAPITLSSTQLASHTHTATDSGHAHTQTSHSHTDSGHGHTVTDPQHSHTMGGKNIGYNSGSTYRFDGESGNRDNTSHDGDNSATGVTVNTGNAAISTVTPTINSGTANLSVSSTGSGANIDNRPPNEVCLKLIRYR